MADEYVYVVSAQRIFHYMLDNIMLSYAILRYPFKGFHFQLLVRLAPECLLSVGHRFEYAHAANVRFPPFLTNFCGGSIDNNGLEAAIRDAAFSAVTHRPNSTLPSHF